ncbi:Histone transcription regulator 3, partial [Linderina macrospora]
MSGMSGREYEKAIRHGLVALQLLSGVLLQQNSLNDMYQGMRAEWIRVTDIVVQAAESDAACHDLVLVYYIAKEWADYELAVAADDIDSAERHIVCCEELFESSQMQESGNAWTRGVKCTFSGVPVSLDLVKSRRGHAASFQALVNAESALASDKEGAAQQLESIVKKFTVDNGAGGHFSFVQKVAAVRLLASIYHEQSQASSEARLIATELFLYIDRLAAECGSDESDTQSVPVRSVVRKCVDCLQRIGEIAQDDGKVWEELARMLDTELFSIGSKQMLALALEMAAYFLTDQPADSLSNVSPEATLVVMAAWLATKLSVGIQPVAVPKGFACVLLNGSDSAIDEKAAVPNTDADADAAPDQANPNDGNLDSQDASGDSSQLLDKYTLLLSAVHQLFGERGMCTVADGCLLKHQMAVCRKALDDDRDNLAYWDTTASCLRCLFDIKLYSSRTLVHACEHLEMDEASASLVYRLVEPELLDAVRSRKGTGLRSDLKAVVDQASAALGELDVDGIPHLSMNMDVLDGYLDGTSMPTFGEAERSLRYSTHDRPLVSLPLRDLHGASKFPDAFWSLPFVRATVQHDLLRSRMKSGMSRAIQDYDEVIDDFKLNVALHPTSSEAWHHLGRAFWDLAEEILLGTANEIVEQRFDVAMLQRSALSCAVQAKQYLEPLPTVAGVEEKRTSKTRNDDESECSDSEEMEQARRLHIRV